MPLPREYRPKTQPRTGRVLVVAVVPVRASRRARGHLRRSNRPEPIMMGLSYVQTPQEEMFDRLVEEQARREAHADHMSIGQLDELLYLNRAGLHGRPAEWTEAEREHWRKARAWRRFHGGQPFVQEAMKRGERVWD